MDFRSERSRASFERLDRERRRNIGRGGKESGPMQSEHAERKHPLSTVEKAQTLLRPEANRGEAVSSEHLSSGFDPVTILEKSLTDDRKGEVGKWRQITRGADGTLGRHDRQQVLTQEVDVALNDQRADARVTLRESTRSEEQHRANQIVR